MKFPFNKVFVGTCLSLTLISSVGWAKTSSDSGVLTEKLLETGKSWDGATWQPWTSGTPQLSVLKITIAPNTSLNWHRHFVPNAAYVLRGELTVEKKSTGETRTLKEGEVLPEMVGSVHRGYAGKAGATLIVFYAGEKGVQLAETVN